MTYIQEVWVPAGTRLQKSRAIPAFGRRGGMEQYFLIDEIPAANFDHAPYNEPIHTN